MDAPFWLKLEMELLTLLFHSLWILQCNTVSADSIIHIGKTPSGAFFLALAKGKRRAACGARLQMGRGRRVADGFEKYGQAGDV